MGLATKVPNKHTGQVISVSTVPRKQKAFLPDKTPFFMSFDIGLFPGENQWKTPLARIFISQEMPAYMLPEVHQVMIDVAHNLEALEIDHVLNELHRTGFIFEHAPMRDIWHGFKNLDTVYVTDVRPELADMMVAMATERASKEMKQT